MTQNINNVILPFDRFEEIRDNFFKINLRFIVGARQLWPERAKLTKLWIFCHSNIYTSDNVSKNKSTNSNVITLTSDCDLIYILRKKKKRKMCIPSTMYIRRRT